MQRYLIVALLGLFTMGCWNDNSLTITNRALASISVVLRDQEYAIAPGASRKVTDIPSGKFEYSTVYTWPAATKSANAGSGLAGNLEFYDNATQYIMIYAGTLVDSVYSIDATLSSTNDQSIVR